VRSGTAMRRPVASATLRPALAGAAAAGAARRRQGPAIGKAGGGSSHEVGSGRAAFGKKSCSPSIV
jgi:hypothetical protein